MKALFSALLIMAAAAAADLPVTKVILYKNGVACYERAGDVKAGEAGRLDFKAAEMDDVLKSLQVETSAGAVARVRVRAERIAAAQARRPGRPDPRPAGPSCCCSTSGGARTSSSTTAAPRSPASSSAAASPCCRSRGRSRS